MQSSDPAAIASKFINHTNRHVFLTGKAGTGKTTFLRHIIQYTHKKAVIVAPTGIAAINAGGVTIHSLFQLPFGNFIPVNQYNKTHNHQFKITDPASLIHNLQMNASKRKLLREIELLIIDEVSMLRADLLDAVDATLKHLRRKHNRSFGGVQVLFIGDMLQLPPVIKEEEWLLLKEHYKSIYFFDALALQREKPLYIELEKIYRQDDNTFISLLNNLRNNTVGNEDLALLNDYYKPGFRPDVNDNYITLTTHNYKADKLNKEYLDSIKKQSYFFEAKIEGDFNEYAYPVEKMLVLKEGAQIMFVKNDPTGAQRFFNGKIGVVSAISNEQVQIKCGDRNEPVILEAYTWQNIKYVLNATTNEVEEKVVGTFTQYPVRLAWAITVHKSQGLTFDKAIIDIEDAFAPGQIYVALSRLRSLQGLVLTSGINFNRLGQDDKIVEFSRSKTEKEDLHSLLNEGENEFLKNCLLDSFNFTNLRKAIHYHVDTYDKVEGRSAKQEYKLWAVELRNMLDKVKPHADTFLNQINDILNKKELQRLDDRVKAAFDYFSPEFKKLSSFIVGHMEHVKNEKRIKIYLGELIELETLFYEQVKRMKRAAALSHAILNKQEVARQTIINALNDQGRIDRINAVFINGGRKKDLPEASGGKKESRKRDKEPKTDTKDITLKLYQQGKSVEEIAQTRGFAVSTIVGHLAQFVAKGKLKADPFISEDKREQIVAASKAANTLQMGPIKALLGEEYSYDDIRFALADHISKQEKST